MADKSQIEWTDATWNPATGCTKVSPGCAYCYITRTPPFRMEDRRFVAGSTDVRLHANRLDQPLRWKRPRRIFVNSLSDLFHEAIPDEFIDQVFAVMALSPQHVFQVLTKRPERMREYMVSDRRLEIGAEALSTPPIPYPSQNTANGRRWAATGNALQDKSHSWPLPNVWLGVTTESQHWAETRIPVLLDTPAAVRFVSAEPLLGAVDLSRYVRRLRIVCSNGMRRDCTCRACELRRAGQPAELPRLSWVIVGGESAGPAARSLVAPCTTRYACLDRNCYPHNLGECGMVGWRPKRDALAWVRSLRDQCVEAGVPFLFKQWGGPTPKSGGRLLDGRTWDEFPEALG